MGKTDGEHEGQERREARAETGPVGLDIAASLSWIVEYVTEVQERTNMAFWDITVHPDWTAHGHANPDAAAAVWRSDCYNDADLFLNGDKIGSREDLRYFIVHELVHLMLRDYDSAIDAAENHLNPASWDIINKWSYREMERAVDFIARAWSPTLPLPPEGKGLP